MMSTPSVWVQLYYKEKEEPKGRPTSVKKPKDVEESEWNVDALIEEAKKNKLKEELDHAGYTEIFVYPPGTKPPFSEQTCIKPGKKLAELIEELKDETPPTSDDHPLIVVAPPQQHANGKKCFRFGSFVYCWIYQAIAEKCFRFFVQLLLNLFNWSLANN